jgi:hypothetical protein
MVGQSGSKACLVGAFYYELQAGIVSKYNVGFSLVHK